MAKRIPKKLHFRAAVRVSKPIFIFGPENSPTTERRQIYTKCKNFCSQDFWVLIKRLSAESTEQIEELLYVLFSGNNRFTSGGNGEFYRKPDRNTAATASNRVSRQLLSRAHNKHINLFSATRVASKCQTAAGVCRLQMLTNTLLAAEHAHGNKACWCFRLLNTCLVVEYSNYF